MDIIDELNTTTVNTWQEEQLQASFLYLTEM